VKPLTFSIVTPSYNQGQFIEETIKSVLGQEGDFYIEYIIVDGGSTDSTVYTIKKYETLLKEKKLPVKCLGIKYRWVSEKDNGQSDAVNKGVEMAKGDFIGWLNSDDCYASDSVIKTVSEEFKKNSTDIVYGNGVMVDADNNFIRDYKSRQVNLKDIVIHPSSVLNQPALFFKKELYFTAGGLDEKLEWTMDYDLWFRMFLKSKRYIYIDQTLARAKYHSDAKSVEHMWKQIIETIAVKKKYTKNFDLSFIDLIHLHFNNLSLIVYYYAVKLGLKKAC